MNRSDILQALDSEITRLQQARTLLAEAPDVLTEAVAARRGPGRPKGSGKVAAKQAKGPAANKRIMSPEGKARIVAAQKARWARLHQAAKKKGKVSPKVAKKAFKQVAKKASGKRVAAGKAPAPAASEQTIS